MGRFVTPDWAAKATAVPYAEFTDPQSLNLYSYVRNVPTTKHDADGHDDALSAIEWWGIENLGGRIWDAVKSIGSDINQAVQNLENSQREHGYGCSCTPQQPTYRESEESNNSFHQNTEQARDAQGKFLPKQGGEAAPGAAAEKEGLEALGAKKNTEAIPGSNRIPDGTIGDVTNGGQYAEIKHGASVSNTAQLREMGAAAVKATGKPLKLGLTNPNVKISSKLRSNENIEVVRLNQK